jgi:hypothetical protein
MSYKEALKTIYWKQFTLMLKMDKGN